MGDDMHDGCDCDKCFACGGDCCKSFCVDIDPPKDLDDFNDLKWYLFHDRVTVFLDEACGWNLDVSIPCRYLDKKGKCTMYDARPPVCRDYEVKGCEVDDAVAVFRSPEDIDAYVEKLRNEGRLKPGKIFK